MNLNYDDLIEETRCWFNYPEFYRDLSTRLCYIKNAKFCEVGTWRGTSLIYFTKECINKVGITNIPEIWGVDAFEKTPSVAVLEQLKDGELEKLWDIYNYNLEKNRVRDYIRDVRKLTVDAAKDFPDEYFDAVFIDANHTYDGLKEDLHAWYPKVKVGGIISGHDYSNNWPGVKQAVDEFSGKKRVLQHKGTVWSWTK